MKPNFIKSEHTSKGFSRGTYKVPELSKNDEKVNGRSAWDDDEEVIDTKTNKTGNLTSFGTKKNPWEQSAFGNNANTNNLSNKENIKEVKTNSENNNDNGKTKMDIPSNTSDFNKSVNTNENQISINETKKNHMTYNRTNEPLVT